MTSPRTLLKAWRLSPNKAMGQNFLADPETAANIVRTAGISPDDTVIEIGAGIGALTVPLAKTGCTLFAVEKDARLAELLQTEILVNHLTNVDIIVEDILRMDLSHCFGSIPGGIIVAGNLPYNISSQVLIQLLAHRNVIRRAVVMLQEELALRIIEPPGSKSYGRISVMLQYGAEIRKALHVQADRFFPKPGVDSTVLLIDFKGNPDFPANDEGLLFRIIKAAFGQRRKTLKNALVGSELHMDPETALRVLKQAGIDPTRRAETLGVREFVKLSNTMGDIRYAGASPFMERLTS